MIVQLIYGCRLGHVGVKRMKKLHKDGFLESLGYESFAACEPCLWGKMTKTPFSGTMERATNLLMLVVGIVFRTFTDDLSRYAYIYLMKHKSEMFEKFKEFQSEVENHRNKNKSFYDMIVEIKYLSYEFGLQLKQCEIVSLLTPPGTPQYNGVSERQNRALLDMVRSMMSLTDYHYRFGVMH